MICDRLSKSRLFTPVVFDAWILIAAFCGKFANHIVSVLYFAQTSTHICSQNLKQTSAGLRKHSSVHTQQPAGPVREVQIDPYIILDDELKYFYDDVRDVSIFGLLNRSEICK